MEFDIWLKSQVRYKLLYLSHKAAFETHSFGISTFSCQLHKFEEKVTERNPQNQKTTNSGRFEWVCFLILF